MLFASVSTQCLCQSIYAQVNVWVNTHWHTQAHEYTLHIRWQYYDTVDSKNSFKSFLRDCYCVCMTSFIYRHRRYTYIHEYTKQTKIVYVQIVHWYRCTCVCLCVYSSIWPLLWKITFCCALCTLEFRIFSQLYTSISHISRFLLIFPPLTQPNDMSLSLKNNNHLYRFYPEINAFRNTSILNWFIIIVFQCFAGKRFFRSFVRYPFYIAYRNSPDKIYLSFALFALLICLHTIQTYQKL